MLETQGVKYLSFDLDDTLWDNAPVLAKAEQAMLSWLHQHCPETQSILTSEGLSAWKQRAFSAKPDGYDISQLRLDALSDLLVPLGYGDTQVKGAFEEFYQARQQVTLFDDAIPVLQQLAERYQLISLTNGNVDPSRLAIAPLFAQHFSAAQLKAKKPNPAIYHGVTKRLKIEGDQIIHIGDSYRLDIEPALRCGWQAIWFNPHAQKAPQPICQVTGLSQLADLLL